MVPGVMLAAAASKQAGGQKGLPAEYKKKLADIDRLYYNARCQGCGWAIDEAGVAALSCSGGLWEGIRRPGQDHQGPVSI